MTDNHFWWYVSLFRINTQLLYFFFTKWPPAAIFGWMNITFNRISLYFRSIHKFYFFNVFHKMAENHFRSHFSPFQINTQLLIFVFTLPTAIFDDRKSLSIAFLAISDQYATFLFKMAAGGHFESPICAKNKSFLPRCVINTYAKYVWQS